MFVGSVPREVVTQLMRVAPIVPGDHVYVCCSGSYRVDLATKAEHPQARVVSNDVSLLSTAVGYYLTHRELDFEFVKDLAWIESEISAADYLTRIGAMLVALQFSSYNGKTDYGRRHIEQIRKDFVPMVTAARAKVEERFAGLSVDGFFGGDFREHAAACADLDGVVLAFPPTYKGGYERMYRRLAENTEWAEPSYGIWDPNEIGDWLADLRSSNTRHCVFVDHALDGIKPSACFQRPRSKPIYLYAHGGSRSSYRRVEPKSAPFRYAPVDPWTLSEQSTVTIGRVGHEQFNFLRNRYLAKGIQFTDGLYNYVVLIDGKVAGGFSYTRDKSGSRDTLYLLSDFSIRRDRKLAKLIAMLATSRQCVADAELTMMLRFTYVFTTVFTDRPVSMKYRGIFDLYQRKPGFLQYQAEIRDATPGDIYREWFKRYAQNDHRPSQAA